MTREKDKGKEKGRQVNGHQGEKERKPWERTMGRRNKKKWNRERRQRKTEMGEKDGGEEEGN